MQHNNIPPASGGRALVITEFGAVGDGETLNTAAVQRALDAAHASGGGVVVVPAGRFRIGTIFLRSNTTLEIQTGGALVASHNIEDYPPMTWGHNKDRQPHHMVVIDHAENVMIAGGGTIDGQGEAFWKEPTGPRQWIGAKERRVSPMIECVGCTNLKLVDFTIFNSPGWTCHLKDCERVTVRGVQLINNLFGPNTDGFDVNGCHDVLISDCYISCGDDAIVLKTTQDSERTCERVAVTNCSIRTNCAGLKLGTESWHDMRQITFSNCVVYQSTRAFALYCLDGATFEDITVDNIVCDTEAGFRLNRPIHIDLRRRTDESKMGAIRNVQVSNFIAKSDGRIMMTAEDGSLLENIFLRDVHLSYPRYDDPDPAGATAGSAQYSNRSPEARVARGAVVADNVANLLVKDLTVVWPKEGTGPDFAVVWGRNLRGGLLDCPLAAPNNPDAEKYCLQHSDIRVRE